MGYENKAKGVSDRFRHNEGEEDDNVIHIKSDEWTE